MPLSSKQFILNQADCWAIIEKSMSNQVFCQLLQYAEKTLNEIENTWNGKFAG